MHFSLNSLPNTLTVTAVLRHPLYFFSNQVINTITFKQKDETLHWYQTAISLHDSNTIIVSTRHVSYKSLFHKQIQHLLEKPDSLQYQKWYFNIKYCSTPNQWQDTISLLYLNLTSCNSATISQFQQKFMFLLWAYTCIYSWKKSRNIQSKY